jgi:hypothetical protein
MTDVSTNIDAASDELLSFRTDYEALEAEIDAVPEADLLTINVTIPFAAQTVLGAMDEILPYASRIEKELPTFKLEQLTKLRPYARAAYHANSLYLIASTPPESIPALVEQCSEFTMTFRADIEALIRRGLLESNALRNLRGTTAHRDVALDLYNIVQLLRAGWAKIEGKTGIQLSELNKAEGLANRLTLALGTRDNAPTLVGPAALKRQRAYTLFMRAYVDVQRAIGYLDPERVDEVVPSVYAPRGPAKKKGDAAAPAQEPAAPVVAQPVVAAAVGPHAALTDASDSPYKA